MIFTRSVQNNGKEEMVMENTINKGVSCGVCECKYNRDGMNCELDKIHVGNTCDCDSNQCTCCDSFCKR